MPIIQTTKELRKRDPKDCYPTPWELCEATVSIIHGLDYEGDKPYILDPGAGAGVWGQAARKRWEHAFIVGVEMDSDRFADKPEGYDTWISQNYLDYPTGSGYRKFDLIVGNPPYGVGADGKKDRKLAEKFVRKSWELLNPEGYIVFLLRTAFSCGQGRGKDFWTRYPLKYKWDLSRRPSFTGNRKTDATDYAIFIWQKNYIYQFYEGRRLAWDYKDDLR